MNQTLIKEIDNRLKHTLMFTEKVANYLKEFRQNNNLEIEKKGEINLVTVADKNAEKMILQAIQNKFPDDNILCEESGNMNARNSFKWIIDPLDGTTNYTHGLPLYGISIGLEDMETSQVLMGVVCLPDLGDIYYATQGSGSYRNKKMISVSKTEKMIDALCCTGFPYNQETIIEDIMFRLKKVMLSCRGVRRTGAATLDLCWLAEGRFDGFWEDFLQPWDMAAASIIIQEAGGRVSTYEGSSFTPYVKNIIASNSILHDELITKLKVE